LRPPRPRRPGRPDGKRASGEPQGVPAKFARPHGKGRDRARGSLPEGMFIVEGVAAIREYLRHKPSSIQKVFAKERMVKAVRDELSEFKVDLSSVPDADDEALPPTPAWAHVRHEMTDWNTFLSRVEKAESAVNRLVLVLDHISDPRNLGAIVRTAAFFGVRHVIVPEKRQVLLTQAGVNTAQGGFALTDLVVVVNVSRAIEELKQKDYWILGAAMGGEGISAVRGRFERQVLVLGSEDKGISQNVLGRCDVVVAIPGAPKSLDSLNVSVAAGILIHELAGGR
jgi:23S rRNA (guanosine2251-2'-O)-methyltransferase